MPSNLVTGSHVLFLSIQVNTLCNVRGLLLQSHQHIAGLIVKACRTRQPGLSKLFHMSILTMALEPPSNMYFHLKTQICRITCEQNNYMEQVWNICLIHNSVMSGGNETIHLTIV